MTRSLNKTATPTSSTQPAGSASDGPPSNGPPSTTDLLVALNAALADLGGTRLFTGIGRASVLLLDALDEPGMREALDQLCAQTWSSANELCVACRGVPATAHAPAVPASQGKVFYGIVRLCARLVGSTDPLMKRTVEGRLLYMWGQYFHRRARANNSIKRLRFSIWKRLMRSAGRASWIEILNTPMVGAWTDLAVHAGALERQADLLARKDMQIEWAHAVDARGGGYQALRVAPPIHAHMLRMFRQPEGHALALVVYLTCLIPLFCSGTRIEVCTLDSLRTSVLAGLHVSSSHQMREQHQTAATSRISHALGAELALHLGDGLDSAAIAETLAPLLRLLQRMADQTNTWPKFP